MLTTKYKTIKIEREKDGITWVIFNRPEKRNAMSPAFHHEMSDALARLEVEPETRLVILTGAGTAFSAGQDLKEYFRATDGKPYEKARASEASGWRSKRLFSYNKPTISMVNGFCIGGAFTQTICADFAVAADEAIFCLSEVNWGILPGGMVSKLVADTLSPRDAMFYACTGRTFDGKKAAEMGLVNFSVPLKNLKRETLKLARELLEKNQNVLRGTKHVIRKTRFMSWDEAADYLAAKGAEIKMRDAAKGHDAYSEGIRQFIDEKSYKPVYSPYNQSATVGSTSTAALKKAVKKTVRKTVRKPAKRKTAGKSTARKKTVRKTTARKPAARRKTTARKTTARRKPVARKKTTARKKPAARKKTTARKKPAARKKTTARKTTARKKPAARKKTTARKKPAARKKTTARKTTARRKPAVRKKTTARQKPAARKKTAARRKK